MTKLIILLLMFFLMDGLTYATDIGLIPQPFKLDKKEGAFIFSGKESVFYNKELKSNSALYGELLASSLGYPLNESTKKRSAIIIDLDRKLDLPLEGYQLQISSDKITLKAVTSQGVFYGLQTLAQLIQTNKNNATVQLPLVEIEDYPRFDWRGCMLDVSRTFMPIPLLKEYIDVMAMYKLNVLHLHLIDDQGWRLEIKQYPNLTKIGSKFDSEFNEMGGYYTQNDIKDLVRYASDRNVIIVPEFELPGHECAAIAAYPNLSCRNLKPKIHPFTKGENIHKEIFCAGKPEVYEFVYNVLDEIIDLFPSKYIHIGGDEAPKDEWQKCAHCQKKMKEEHLENEEELQSYFVKQVGEYLRNKNRVLIGWDEIMDGGKLQGDEIVMYWRGWYPQVLETCIEKQFKVIGCPTSHCYFDYDHKTIDSKKIYSYDPEENSPLAKKQNTYVGIQANFWSHLDRSEANIDKQLFPRLFALAESAWTIPENKDWNRFKTQAKAQSELLREKEINCFYDQSIYELDN